MADKKVTINATQPVDDPSGGPGHVVPCTVSDIFFRIKKGHPRTIKFTLEGAGTNAKFTAFRYYNTTETKEGWYYPDGAIDPQIESVRPGSEFTTQKITNGGKTLTVYDTANNSTMYFYILEWTEGPEDNQQTYICDPKIKNQP